MTSFTPVCVTRGSLQNKLFHECKKHLPASSAGRTCYAWAAAVTAVVLGPDAVPGMAVAVPAGSG